MPRKGFNFINKLLLSYNRATQTTTLPIYVLRSRVNNQISPKFNRVLNHRGGKAIINYVNKIVLFRDLFGLRHVDDIQRRIRWGFEVDNFSVWGDGIFPSVHFSG